MIRKIDLVESKETGTAVIRDCLICVFNLATFVKILIVNVNDNKLVSGLISQWHHIKLVY